MANPSPASEVYKVIRPQVEHVDNNLSQRVIWLVIAQSFFFSGYAILVTGKAGRPELESVHVALLHILPIAALLTVLFTSIDVITAIVYMKGLRKKYEDSLNTDVDIDGPFPSITGSRSERLFMHASPILIPMMFVAIWIILIVIQASHPIGSVPPPPPGQ